MLKAHKPVRAAFSLVELLIVIGIIALLLAILLPVLYQVRAKGRESVCASNLRQVGAAMLMYTADFDDKMPYGGDPIDLNTDAWQYHKFVAAVKTLRPVQVVLLPYTASLEIWHCPSDTGFLTCGTSEEVRLAAAPSAFQEYGNSYAYHTGLALYQNSASTVQVWNRLPPFEERGPESIDAFFDLTGVWHGGFGSQSYRYVTLFLDGHVKSLFREELIDDDDVSFTPPGLDR